MAMSNKQRFIWAVGIQESGGSYDAINSVSGALGRWQVMPANVPGWTAKAVGHSLTSSQFYHSHYAQDRVAWVILGGDYDTYGARGAAAVWYSGQPDWHATYGNPPVYAYVDSIIAIMARGGGQPINPGGGGDGVTVGPPPSSKEYDYSHRVRKSAGNMNAAAVYFHRYARAIHRI
jgi:hypothetical protein